MDLKLNSILILLVFTCFAKGCPGSTSYNQVETITGKRVHHGGYFWICDFTLATDGSNDVVTACSTVTCNRPKAKIIRDLTVHGTYGSYKLTFNTKNSASVRGTLEIWGPCPASYPYGLGEGPVYISFSDRGDLSNGLLSRIEITHDNNGINALQSTFGVNSGPGLLHGTQTGTIFPVDISPGFYIKHVSGTYGAKINSLNFHISDGSSTGDVGVYAGHEFEAFPPHSHCFLAYLSGSTDSNGITLIMFNWACGEPQNQAARKCEAYPSTLVSTSNINQHHRFTDYPVSEAITKIRVYTGLYGNTDQVIKCIQVKYGSTWGEKHGQHDTGDNLYVNDFSSSDPITGVYGTAGDRVNNFNFKTLAGDIAFGVDGSGTPPYDANPPCADGTLAYISGNYYHYEPTSSYTLLNGFYYVVFHWKCPGLSTTIDAVIGNEIATGLCPACGACPSCCGICLPFGDICVGSCP